MWHALIYVACALVHHVLEHDAECGECPVTSPNRLTRQPVRRSRLARSRPRSCPDRLDPGTRVPGRRWASMPDTRSPSRWSKARRLWRPGKSMPATRAGCLQALLRNVGEWEHAEGELSPFPGMAAVSAQVRLR